MATRSDVERSGLVRGERGLSPLDSVGKEAALPAFQKRVLIQTPPSLLGTTSFSQLVGQLDQAFKTVTHQIEVELNRAGKYIQDDGSVMLPGDPRYEYEAATKSYADHLIPWFLGPSDVDGTINSVTASEPVANFGWGWDAPDAAVTDLELVSYVPKPFRGRSVTPTLYFTQSGTGTGNVRVRVRFEEYVIGTLPATHDYNVVQNNAAGGTANAPNSVDYTAHVLGSGTRIIGGQIRFDRSDANDTLTGETVTFQGLEFQLTN